MKEYLSLFFEEFAYPTQACDVLMGAYDKICSNAPLNSAFETLLQCYASDKNMDYAQAFQKMAKISNTAKIHEYTGNLLLLICFSRTLRQYYQEEGIAEQIWHTSMCDLKYKLDECKCVYDIWGTFVPWWYDEFFNLTRFGFGKLQFEIRPFGHHYEKNGIVLTPDSRVLNIHIPRTGEKLDPESVQKSYELSAQFFKERYQVDPAVFVCNSWLLFPRNLEVLSPDSNLYSFISGFDILEVAESENYSEVWRLFDTMYDGDVEKLPQDTSLRRAYAEWIRKGERIGGAYGVHIL